MTPAEYDAIAARAEAALDGPWYVAYSDWEDSASIRQDESPRLRGSYVEVATSEQCADDSSPTAEFIAHARTDIPALLAALRERDTTITQLQDALTVAREECRYADLDAKVNRDTANKAEASVARVRALAERWAEERIYETDEGTADAILIAIDMHEAATDMK